METVTGTVNTLLPFTQALIRYPTSISNIPVKIRIINGNLETLQYIFSMAEYPSMVSSINSSQKESISLLSNISSTAIPLSSACKNRSKQ